MVDCRFSDLLKSEKCQTALNITPLYRNGAQSKLIQISISASNDPSVEEAMNATSLEVKLWNKAIEADSSP